MECASFSAVCLPLPLSKHFLLEPKREKITEVWEKLQKTELHDLYFSLLKSNHGKEIEMDEERGTHGGQEISRILMGKLVGKRPLGTPDIDGRLIEY